MELISNVKVYDLAESIAASGYPMRTQTKKELKIIEKALKKGNFGKTAETEKIYKRVVNLGNSTGGHDQFLTGIRVSFDLTFSNKAWVEAERYRFLEFVSSQSTMHKMCSFNLDLQYNEYVDKRIVRIMKQKVKEYNKLSAEFDVMKANGATEEEITAFAEMLAIKYLEILYSNPAGFLITARLTTNYRCLKNIYFQRKGHRLPEWREFCKWIEENLPYFKEFCLNK